MAVAAALQGRPRFSVVLTSNTFVALGVAMLAQQIATACHAGRAAASGVLARSSPRGHPPLWKPTRLLSTTLWAQKSALALVGVKHGCGAALAPSVADSAAFGHSGTSAHYWMAAGAMALLALACGAVFVGAAAPKGEAVTEGMGAEAGETSLDVEHTRGTHVSTRR